MSHIDSATEEFEQHRGRLRSVAYRMLGEWHDADEAVQESWLRLQQSPVEDIRSVGAWLTTVLTRICLDQLRARTRRRELMVEVDDVADLEQIETTGAGVEQMHLLAESVGVALLVVLDRLKPAERVAFVLHDMFDLPFDEIALLIDRSPVATRQLASRARRRVRGASADATHKLKRERQLAEAFLAAARSGDMQGLLKLLDPDVVLKVDETAAQLGAGPGGDVHGAQAVASYFPGRAAAGYVAKIDGAIGIIVAPQGRLLLALRTTIRDGRIARLEAVADSEELARLELSMPGALR
jgi:RNA polymerase sigma-70 factor, ECF subfamily